jgi:predicted transcriptional regulator
MKGKKVNSRSNKNDLERLLRETSLPSRIEIISLLKEDCVTLSELHKRLKANGVKVPVSTVYRAVNNLFSTGILDKKNGEVSLTPAGLFFADALNCMERLMNFEYLELATDFLLSLPPELRFGIHHLSECEKVDFTETRKLSINVLSSVREGGLYIDRVVDPDLFEVMIKRRLQGATEKVISAEDVVFQKIETEIEALKNAGLNKEEMRAVEEKVELKVLTPPLQMGIIDRKVGIVMLIKGNYFTPFFVTDKKDAIRWLESVFNYYWDLAKPLDEYIEGGMEGLRKMILSAVSKV